MQGGPQLRAIHAIARGDNLLNGGFGLGASLSAAGYAACALSRRP